MPYVTIRIIKELATTEIKAQLIARTSEAVADVLAGASDANRDKVLANLWCVIEEIPFDGWGVGGVQASRQMLEKVVELEA
jgi:4-oxalocrotonate tautomerase family enzyme